MHDRYDVLVAAGGHAGRMSPFWPAPKCLLKIGDVTSLDRLLTNIYSAKRDAAVLVSTNRTEHLPMIRGICDAHGAALITDRGFASTVELALFATPLMTPHFAFFYGHAFVTPVQMVEFLDGGEAAASYTLSTRRDPIMSMGRYLEPPFRVQGEALRQFRPATWGLYWSRPTNAPRAVLIDSPSEPNSWPEQMAYEKYWLSASA